MTEEETVAAGAARKQDLANLKKVGLLHSVAFVATLTLWGAADTWASVSGWGLAHAVAIANSVLAATIVTGILHEWGHYAGARLAGSATQALEKPVGYFFMFNFPFDQNGARQFLWMSWGGILMPWVLVALCVGLVPMDTASRAILLAVFISRAVQVSFFEIPVAWRTSSGGDPQKELERRLLSGALGTGGYVGTAVGILAFFLV